MTQINAGFIGLGNIGKPMASHLNTITDTANGADKKTNSIQLYIYDILTDAMTSLVDAGAIASPSPAAMAKNCSYIGLCVRDDHDIESLLYGEQGILAHAQKNCLIAIHSTVTQANLLRWAADAKKQNIDLIDAPMTGGASGATAGTLCYMVGGTKETLERCRPFLQSSAEKIIHAGELGAGIALKLCNNLITYSQFTAMSEATRLAEACGLSAEVLREVGKSNGIINEQMYSFITARSTLAANADTATMEQYMSPMGKLGEKDLNCAIETASDLAVDLPATEFIRDMIADVFVGKY